MKKLLSEIYQEAGKYRASVLLILVALELLSIFVLWAGPYGVIGEVLHQSGFAALFVISAIYLLRFSLVLLALDMLFLTVMFYVKRCDKKSFKGGVMVNIFSAITVFVFLFSI